MNLNVPKEILQRISAFNQANPYVDITPYELNMGMPIIHYPGFLVQPGECIIFAAPARTFKDKSQIVGYTRKSVGASFRVSKGLTLRTGSSGGKPIREIVREHNSGDLLVTNKRVVFIGKDDSFNYPVEKIWAIKMLDNQSFILQSGRTAKNLSLDPVLALHAAGFISYVQQEVAAGIDVYQNHQAILTPDQLAYCAAVRQESIRMSVEREKSKRLWTIVKVISVLVFLIAVAVTISIVSSAGGGKVGTYDHIQTSGTITNYSAVELVTLSKHPRIFDSYAEAQVFYKSVGDRRIAVTDLARKSIMTRSLKNLYDDEIVLYITQDSTSKKYVGTIEINIYDSDFAANMTLASAVDIVISYLPADFFAYYISDASYVYKTTEDTRVFTYSCRLSDAGVKYRNSVAPQYSPYYYIRIYEYLNGKYWKITTGYSAYGDHDKGWIDKYAEPWDAPIQ